MGSGVVYPKTFLRAPDKKYAQHGVVSESLEVFIRWIRFSPILCFYSTSYLQFVKDIASPNISTHGIWSSIPQNFSQGTRQDVCTIRGCFRRSGRFYPVDQFSLISCFWKSDLQSGEGYHQSEHKYPLMGSGVVYPKTFLRAPDKKCAQYEVVSESLEGFIRWIRFSLILCF